MGFWVGVTPVSRTRGISCWVWAHLGGRSTLGHFRGRVHDFIGDCWDVMGRFSLRDSEICSILRRPRRYTFLPVWITGRFHVRAAPTYWGQQTEQGSQVYHLAPESPCPVTSWSISESFLRWRPWCQERLNAKKGAAKDDMARLHQGLSGHEFEQTPGDTRGQGSLACCSPWGCKEWDTTEQLTKVR